MKNILMKKTLKSGLLLLVTFFVFQSCSQVSSPTAKETAKAPVSGFVFDVNERPGGAAFYVMNNLTGELSYMLDHGEAAGQWINYGNTLNGNSVNPLQFKVIEGGEGTIFYAMDGVTGQMYYMQDYGETIGQWGKYGGMIRQNALNMLQLDVVGRSNGNTTFYAYDSFTHQTYFMNLFGDDAGKWNKYGTPYTAEAEAEAKK